MRTPRPLWRAVERITCGNAFYQAAFDRACAHAAPIISEAESSRARRLRQLQHQQRQHRQYQQQQQHHHQQQQQRGSPHHHANHACTSSASAVQGKRTQPHASCHAQPQHSSSNSSTVSSRGTALGSLDGSRDCRYGHEPMCGSGERQSAHIRGRCNAEERGGIRSSGAGVLPSTSAHDQLGPATDGAAADYPDTLLVRMLRAAKALANRPVHVLDDESGLTAKTERRQAPSHEQHLLMASVPLPTSQSSGPACAGGHQGQQLFTQRGDVEYAAHAHARLSQHDQHPASALFSRAAHMAFSGNMEDVELRAAYPGAGPRMEDAAGPAALCPSSSDGEIHSQAASALKLFALAEAPDAVAYTLRCMEDAGIALDDSHMHQLLRCYALAGNLSRLQEALALLARGRQWPSEEMWKTILSAYQDHGANDLLQRTEETLTMFLHGCPTADTTDAASSQPSAQPSLAAAAAPPPPSHHDAADTHALSAEQLIDEYHAALSAARQLQLPVVGHAILRHALQHLPCPPPVSLWNQLAWTYANCRQPQGVRALMERMMEARVDPDLDTTAFLIMAHGRAHQGDQAMALYEKLLREHPRVTETVYLCIMDALAQMAHPQEARAVFERMTKSGVAPSVTAYNKLVKAYAHSRSPDLAGRVVDNMQEDGHAPNETTYRCWMYGHARCRDPDGAEALLHAMTQQGLEPTAQTYNILLYCYALAGELNTARAVIDRMVEAGERPLTVSFNVLANGYGRQHNMDGLRMLIADMAAAKVQPNVVTYNTLIKSFCMNHQVQRAESMVDRMIESGLMGDVSTWGALAGAYARRGSTEKVILTLRRCVASGCVPNRQLFDMVVFLLTRASLPESERAETVQTIARMIVEAAQEDEATHTALIQHCLHVSGHRQ